MKKITNIKVGDTVEMVSNLGKEILAMPKPRLRIITGINGYYVYVKPNGMNWIQEFYRHEIKHR